MATIVRNVTTTTARHSVTPVRHPRPSAEIASKYRDRPPRGRDVVEWARQSADGASNMAQLARWATDASATGWAMARDGRICAANPAFEALCQPSPSGVWKSIAASPAPRAARRNPGYLSLRELALHEAQASVQRARGHRSRFSRGNEVFEVAVEPQTLRGEPATVLVMVEDVTRLARAEADARTSQELLVHRERLRAIGELAFGISHDVNNTLAALRLRLSVMLKDELCALRQGDNLEASLRILGQGADLVAKLRDLGRREPPRVSAVDLRETIRDAIEIAQSGMNPGDATGAQVHIRSELPALPAVRGYTEDLKHVFVNLFLNARDAMPKGGRIWVRARQDDGGVWVRIEDEGTGIPDEHLGRIFDAFFTTKGDKGTGMGLAMAKTLIERLGGSIAAGNRREGGAWFEIHFLPHDAHTARLRTPVVTTSRRRQPPRVSARGAARA